MCCFFLFWLCPQPVFFLLLDDDSRLLVVRTDCFTVGSFVAGDRAENRLKAAPAWTHTAARTLAFILRLFPFLYFHPLRTFFMRHPATTIGNNAFVSFEPRKHSLVSLSIFLAPSNRLLGQESACVSLIFVCILSCLPKGGMSERLAAVQRNCL